MARRITSDREQNGPNDLHWSKGQTITVEDDQVATDLLSLDGFTEVNPAEDTTETIHGHPVGGWNKGGSASGDPSPLDVPTPDNKFIPPLKPSGPERFDDNADNPATPPAKSSADMDMERQAKVDAEAQVAAQAAAQDKGKGTK